MTPSGKASPLSMVAPCFHFPPPWQRNDSFPYPNRALFPPPERRVFHHPETRLPVPSTPLRSVGFRRSRWTHPPPTDARLFFPTRKPSLRGVFSRQRKRERRERARGRVTEHSDTRFKLSRLWGADHYLDEPPGSLDKTRWGRSGRRANSPLSLCPYHTHSTDVLLPLRPLPSRSSFLSFPPAAPPPAFPAVPPRRRRDGRVAPRRRHPTTLQGLRERTTRVSSPRSYTWRVPLMLTERVTLDPTNVPDRGMEIRGCCVTGARPPCAFGKRIARFDPGMLIGRGGSCKCVAGAPAIAGQRLGLRCFTFDRRAAVTIIGIRLCERFGAVLVKYGAAVIRWVRGWRLMMARRGLPTARHNLPPMVEVRVFESSGAVGFV